MLFWYISMMLSKKAFKVKSEKQIDWHPQTLNNGIKSMDSCYQTQIIHSLLWMNS